MSAPPSVRVKPHGSLERGFVITETQSVFSDPSRGHEVYSACLHTLHPWLCPLHDAGQERGMEGLVVRTS